MTVCKLFGLRSISYLKPYKVKLATVVEGDLKASFSFATMLRYMRECYSLLWIGPFYP